METRSLDLEIRAEASGDHPRRLVGMAVVYDAEADMGEFVERIRPGALDRTLAENRNIKARFEHNQLLATTKNGTLTLDNTPEGLRVTMDVAETRVGDDAIALVTRGDIDAMSFGFVTRSQTFTREGDKVYRDILDLDLYEVTVTDRPAYEATSIARRSIDQAAIDEAKRLATRPTLTDYRNRIRCIAAA